MDLPVTFTGHLLLVSHDAPPDAVMNVITEQMWRYLIVNDPERAFYAVRTESPIDVVVLCPRGDDLEAHLLLCREIKLEPSTSFVSVVFVGESDNEIDRTRAFEAGADGFIRLPASDEELLARLRNAIRAKHATDSLEDANIVVTSLANAVEGRDKYTCGHIERVAMYAVEIGKRFGLSMEELSTLRIGAMVHDIGKVSVPDQILNKPGRLDDEEMRIIQRHPLVGYDILQPMRTFRAALPIVRWHHERPNGTGYPDGLAGDDLPIQPRIVAVADCFDAISTDRPYRTAMPMTKCKDLLRELADKDELDARVVTILLDILAQGEKQRAEVASEHASAASH